MNYTNARVINSEGGLLVERDDGTFFYCAPGNRLAGLSSIGLCGRAS